MQLVYHFSAQYVGKGELNQDSDIVTGKTERADSLPPESNQQRIGNKMNKNKWQRDINQ